MLGDARLRHDGKGKKGKTTMAKENNTEEKWLIKHACRI